MQASPRGGIQLSVENGGYITKTEDTSTDLRYFKVVKSGKLAALAAKKASESCPTLEQCRRL